MHILQHKISLHFDASMLKIPTPNWILHNNCKIRTPLQCHPELYLLKKKRGSNLKNSTFFF